MRDGSNRGYLVVEDHIKQVGRNDIMESELPTLEVLDFILLTMGHK